MRNYLDLIVPGIALIIIALGCALIFKLLHQGVIDALAGKALRDSLHWRSLVHECAPYYNDGTERWMECMGVEYKR